MLRRMVVALGMLGALAVVAGACSIAEPGRSSFNDSGAVTESRTEPSIAPGDPTGRSSASPDAVKQADAPGASAPAAPPQTGGAQGQPQTNGATTLDRKIIQNAILALQVDDVAPSYDQVMHIVTVNGGFVATSRFSYDKDGKQVASATLKVPANRYQPTLSDLRRLAVKVENEQNGSNDVTEEYSDLQARMRNLESTEAQYLELMKSARNVTEVLTVQDRLNTVRAEIERTKGRANLLDRSSELATITVSLRTVPPVFNADDPKSLTASAVEAWNASLATLRGLAVVAVYVLAFGWWLIPALAIVGFILRGRFGRSRVSTPEAPPA
jgi:hypothetical protein